MVVTINKTSLFSDFVVIIPIRLTVKYGWMSLELNTWDGLTQVIALLLLL